MLDRTENLLEFQKDPLESPSFDDKLMVRLGGLPKRSDELELTRLHFLLNKPMYLLYLDDAGSAKNASETHLVLGGICLHENQVHYLTQQLDELASKFNAADPDSVEFHASAIFSRKTSPWKGLSKEEARQAIVDVLVTVQGCYKSARVFACAVQKNAFPEQDPMELAFEDLCSRFDMFLSRQERDTRKRHRGMIVLDESAHETSIHRLSREFRRNGTRWGNLRNIIDAPFFVDSRRSRCVQVADHVAYAVYRRYEHRDAYYFDIFADRFDRDSGRVHGLAHIPYSRGCPCLCCENRSVMPPATHQ